MESASVEVFLMFHSGENVSFVAACGLLGLNVEEESHATLGELLCIAPPAPRMPRLPEPEFLADLGVDLAMNPPNILHFQRKKVRIPRPTFCLSPAFGSVVLGYMKTSGATYIVGLCGICGTSSECPGLRPMPPTRPQVADCRLQGWGLQGCRRQEGLQRCKVEGSKAAAGCKDASCKQNLRYVRCPNNCANRPPRV